MPTRFRRWNVPAGSTAAGPRSSWSAGDAHRERRRYLPEGFFEQIEGGHRERPHVVDPVGLAGLDRDRALDPADHRDAGMTGGMAVAAAGRAGGAGLADRPGRTEALLDLAREQECVGLGRGGDA